MKSASTIQDDIPPVHVLEAAQNQDRKETEDLLAGFDRPGRGPKPASKERDFVDYYARKKAGGAESAEGTARRPTSSAPPASVKPKQADVATVIVHRKSEGMPAWLVWGGAAAVMLLVGGVVAYLATADAHPDATSPKVPSAATTITSAASPMQTNGDNNIPPPGPAEPSATTTTAVTVTEPAPTALTATSTTTTAPSATSAPRGSAKREPRGGTNANAAAGAMAPRGTNATDDKPPPRDDFIRDL